MKAKAWSVIYFPNSCTSSICCFHKGFLTLGLIHRRFDSIFFKLKLLIPSGGFHGHVFLDIMFSGGDQYNPPQKKKKKFKQKILFISRNNCLAYLRETRLEIPPLKLSSVGRIRNWISHPPWISCLLELFFLLSFFLFAFLPFFHICLKLFYF